MSGVNVDLFEMRCAVQDLDLSESDRCTHPGDGNPEKTVLLRVAEIRFAGLLGNDRFGDTVTDEQPGCFALDLGKGADMLRGGPLDLVLGVHESAGTVLSACHRVKRAIPA